MELKTDCHCDLVDKIHGHLSLTVDKAVHAVTFTTKVGGLELMLMLQSINFPLQKSMDIYEREILNSELPNGTRRLPDVDDKAVQKCLEVLGITTNENLFNQLALSRLENYKAKGAGSKT